MNKIEITIEKSRHGWNGRAYSEADKLALGNLYHDELFDRLLISFSDSSIINCTCSLTEFEDNSGLGVEMKWMSAEEQIDEAQNFYPGIVAIKKKFYPIGECLSGSGDPYFVKFDGNQWMVYRIPHNAIVNNELEIQQIEYVCQLDFLISKLA